MKMMKRTKPGMARAVTNLFGLNRRIKWNPKTSKIEAQQAKIAALQDNIRIIAMEDINGSVLRY